MTLDEMASEAVMEGLKADGLNRLRMRLRAAGFPTSQRNPRHCDSGLAAPY
jgi:hypothetical protein